MNLVSLYIPSYCKMLQITYLYKLLDTLMLAFVCNNIQTYFLYINKCSVHFFYTKKHWYGHHLFYVFAHNNSLVLKTDMHSMLLEAPFVCHSSLAFRTPAWWLHTSVMHVTPALYNTRSWNCLWWWKYVYRSSGCGYISSMARVLYVWLNVINIWKYYETFPYRICWWIVKIIFALFVLF